MENGLRGVRHGVAPDFPICFDPAMPRTSTLSLLSALSAESTPSVAPTGTGGGAADTDDTDDKDAKGAKGAKAVAGALDVTPLRAAAQEASALLRALANEDRLLILCQLTQGELSVGELEAQLDIRQPTLSQQLAVLRTEALVTTRREGKRIYYSVADGAVLAVLACLYAQFCPKA
ncbi:Biofilm growth-associated repressor [Pandoraea pnomenusa]|uniref:Biofilm growth-associated repressor n=1 Tax=Pandoraea pnomenusa TaxID=93220 RepID=A0A378YKS1_9BURK|nr:Biofilm growth-associated repressor [Pandoraea pnomenusa]